MLEIHNKLDLTLLSLLLCLALATPFVVDSSGESINQVAAPSQLVPIGDVVANGSPKEAFSASILPQIPRETSTTNIVAINEPINTNGLPDFAAMRDVRAKKQQFFSYMLPMIRESNDQIHTYRSLLQDIRNELLVGNSIDRASYELVGGLSKRFRVRPNHDLLTQVEALLVRVDVVPESLVLAQAANESGWGTSRFAREANNLFGVWCFTEGCGLTPLSRDDGLTHEVARYNSVQDSVNAYIHTINTHSAYESLRSIRSNTRAEEALMSGLALAEGLLKYSARGLDYVREIQQLIRVNNLQQFTLPLNV